MSDKINTWMRLRPMTLERKIKGDMSTRLSEPMN